MVGIGRIECGRLHQICVAISHCATANEMELGIGEDVRDGRAPARGLGKAGQVRLAR